MTYSFISGKSPFHPLSLLSITAKKQTNKQTKQQQKFLSTIAHFSGVDYGLLSNK